MLVLGIAEIWVGIDRSFANEFTASNIIPSLDAGMSYLPVIIFNFMGFLNLAGGSSALKNPSRDIPKAVLLGGGLIMVFYILATLGILATMPIDQISDSTGAIEAFAVIFGNSPGAKALIAVLGIMFLYTLISNVATWAMGSTGRWSMRRSRALAGPVVTSARQNGSSQKRRALERSGREPRRR